jgi:hypothetical protein
MIGGEIYTIISFILLFIYFLSILLNQSNDGSINRKRLFYGN